MLRSLNELGCTEVVNSAYYAVINEETCTACGLCAEERCQVNAIEEKDDVYQVLVDLCIGCGLCISTCPSESISLLRKPEDKITTPPENEEAWLDQRAEARGVDYSHLK